MRISWESRENLGRSSWDHCTLMRISWENFSLVRISWESHENSVQASISIFRVFMRKRPNMLMRISWHSHEILMRKRSNFHVKKRLTRISWETQEKSHEKLMKARKSHEKTFQFSRENENLVRFSWDLVKSSWDSHENRWQFSFSHENLMRFSWVLMRIFVRVSTMFGFPIYLRKHAHMKFEFWLRETSFAIFGVAKYHFWSRCYQVPQTAWSSNREHACGKKWRWLSLIFP